METVRKHIAQTRCCEKYIQPEGRIETALVYTAQSRRSLEIDLNLDAFNYNALCNYNVHSIDVLQK